VPLVLAKFVEIAKVRRRQLIDEQFVAYSGPLQKSRKVISRSGEFRKSIKFRTIKTSKYRYNFSLVYDHKYQAVQPDDDRRILVIRPRRKKYLTIPNPLRSELFTDTGAYKYAGIPLYKGGKPNPKHPYSKKLRFFPKGRTRNKNKHPRLIDSRGRVFYILKREVKIVTKRPISKANAKFLKETQPMLNQAFALAWKDYFGSLRSNDIKQRRR
jgi:hypothetical protein